MVEADKMVMQGAAVAGGWGSEERLIKGVAGVGGEGGEDGFKDGVRGVTGGPFGGGREEWVWQERTFLAGETSEQSEGKRRGERAEVRVVAVWPGMEVRKRERVEGRGRCKTGVKHCW